MTDQVICVTLMQLPDDLVLVLAFTDNPLQAHVFCAKGSEVSIDRQPTLESLGRPLLTAIPPISPNRLIGIIE